MTATAITLHAKAEGAAIVMREIVLLLKTIAYTADLLLEFQDLLADGTKAFIVHSEFIPTIWTGELTVFFEPSQRLLELLAALRARNGNRPVIDVGMH